jgi:RNA-directed DNA polymerase
MLDRVMQALVKLALEPEWEPRFEANSYGFRPGRCTDGRDRGDLPSRCRKGSSQWVLDADIAKCFDEIEHAALLGRLPVFTTTIRRWLKAGVVELGTLRQRRRWARRKAGSSRPCWPTSPLMAWNGCSGPNVRRPPGSFPVADREQPGHQPHPVCRRLRGHRPIQGGARKRGRPRLAKFLADRGLELSAAKTRIVHIDDGFDFLGFNIRRFPNGKLLVRPQKEKVSAHRRALSAFLRENRQRPTAEVIKALSPVIRGWCNYYRHAVAKRTFSALDHHVWRITYKWAKRRHPNKNTPLGSQPLLRRRSGIRLGPLRRPFPASTHNETRVSRFVKVKGKSSPFDPNLRDYWEDRRHRRLVREAGRSIASTCSNSRMAGARSARRRSMPTLISTTTPTSCYVVTSQPETLSEFSSTAGAVLDGSRSGGRATRWQMLEPYAGRLARTVLRGPGRSQDFPGYPTLWCSDVRH